MNSHKAIQETLKKFSITSDELLDRLRGDWSKIDFLKAKDYIEGKYAFDYVHSTTLNYIEDALPSEAKFYYFALRMCDNNRVYENFLI